MARLSAVSLVGGAAMLGAIPLAVARPLPSLAELGADKRVLIVSASSADDPRLAAQRRETRRWGAAARARDLVGIEITGTQVTGARDGAADLRRRYRLPRHGFAIALIGKDHHVAYRTSRPLSARSMIAIIDAMPMRRAGLR